MRLTLGLVIALFACKSDSEFKAPPAKPLPPPKDPINAIAKQPRTPTAAKTNFLELTIALPPSASMPIKEPLATSWTFKDSKLALKVTEFGDMASQTPLPPPPPASDKITYTATKEADGYILFTRNVDASGFKIEICRDLDPTAPPSTVCCVVEMTSDKPLEDINSLVAFGTEMCRSIKVKNRKVAPPAAEAPPPAPGSAAPT